MCSITKCDMMRGLGTFINSLETANDSDTAHHKFFF